MQQRDVLGRRIGAGAIDLGVVLVIVLFVGGIFGNDVGPDAPDSARFGALDRLLVVILAFAYYWISEARSGQTLGKRVLNIRVVSVDGSKASVGATGLRTLLRAIDGLLFYAVALVAVLATGQRRQRLGDMAAKTRVVDASEPLDRPSDPPPPPPDEDIIAQIMR